MNRADGMRLVRDARDLEGLKLSPQEDNVFQPSGSKTYVRVTGVKNTYANGYPGVLVYRDLSVNDPTSTGAWVDGEVVLAEEINNGTLTIGRRYLCQGWGLKTFTDGDGDQLGWFVEVDKGSGADNTGFFARLTTVSGGLWKWVQIGWHNAGSDWVDIGSESSDYTAAPLPVDGTNVCNPVTGLRVWMTPSVETAGYYEFEPYGYADKVSGNYYPGLWNTNIFSVQTFRGSKQLDGSWGVRDSVVVNTLYAEGCLLANSELSDVGVSTSSGLYDSLLFCNPYERTVNVGPGNHRGTGVILPGSYVWALSVAGHVNLCNQLSLIPGGLLYLNGQDGTKGGLTAYTDSSLGIYPWAWTALYSGCVDYMSPGAVTPFPADRGISVLSGSGGLGGSVGQYGMVCIGGVLDQVVVYDGSPATGHGKAVFRSEGTGQYVYGVKWQGGDDGPFYVCNGIIVGLSSGSTTAGQMLYFNGTAWVVLNSPPVDGVQYILMCTDRVLSWVAGSCPPPMSGMANGPPTGPGEGDMSPSETETTPLPMAAEPETPKLSYPPVNVRHCLYHLYPLNTANGLWRWNVEQLCKRMSLFNGQIIVAVAFDPPDGRKPDPTGTLGVNHYAKPGRADVSGECASFAQVYQAFGDHAKRVEFIEVENDPELCELASFDLLYGRLRNNRNDDEAIFYGHSKGITHKKGSVTKLWTDTMYKTYLDYWPVVQDVLSNHPVAGSFKVHGPGWDERNSRSQWHYSGSFLWVRTAPLFAKQWRKIDRFWSGIEPWPSLHFQDNEAGVIFHENSNTRMALYKKSYWMDKVIPELVKWVDKNRTVPAELEELYAAAAQGPTNISEHLPTLRRYAEQVYSVVEFGVETGQSTLAFLAGLHGRGKLSSFDVVKTDEAATLAERFKDCFEFRVGSTVPGDIVPENYRGFIKDTPVVDIPECDLLFIDTIHEGWCLDSELERYHAKVSKFIVMHDTELYGDVGSDGKPGLRTSIEQFLSNHPEWVLVEEFKNNNGLTVLAKSLNLNETADLKNGVVRGGDELDS